MPHRDESFGPQQSLRISVGIDIGNVRHIVSVLLHPIRKREFPGQVFAGTAGSLVLVHRMGKQAVGTVETHRSTGDTLGIEAWMIGINRVVSGPTIVGAPRQFAALKQEIAGAVIAHDEDDVALNVLLLRSQLSQVDAAQPILGDLEFHGRIPIAVPHIVFAHRRVYLSLALEGVETFHQPRTITVVITSTENLQLKIGDRIRADHDAQLLTRTHAIGGTVAFNPWAAPVVENFVYLSGELASFSQLPVGRAWFGIFNLNQISSRQTGYARLPDRIRNTY